MMKIQKMNMVNEVFFGELGDCRFVFSSEDITADSPTSWEDEIMKYMYEASRKNFLVMNVK